MEPLGVAEHILHAVVGFQKAGYEYKTESDPVVQIFQGQRPCDATSGHSKFSLSERVIGVCDSVADAFVENKFDVLDQFLFAKTLRQFRYFANLFRHARRNHGPRITLGLSPVQMRSEEHTSEL